MMNLTCRPEPPLTPALPDRLRLHTRDLHQQAERSGVMAALLRGAIERAAYTALLRNLHAIYAALEAALQRRRADAVVAPLVMPPLFRTQALADDLLVLHGAGWPERLPLQPAALAYVQRLQALAEGASPALAAHAYVRYLGDLNGGQVLKRLVSQRLALAGEQGVRFYAFGDPAALPALRERFRAALAALPLAAEAGVLVEAEARWAFQQHIRLFEELAA